MKKDNQGLLFLVLLLVFMPFAAAKAEAPAVVSLDAQEIDKMRLVTEAYVKMQRYYYRELMVPDLERFMFRLEVIAGAMLKTPGGNFEEKLEQLIYGTIEWMVLEMRDASDQHSKFIHKRFLERVVRENFKSEFQGIGIEIEKKDAGIFVATVYPGSSASENDVRVGDQLMKVGDRDVVALSFDEVKTLLDIPSGESIALGLSRAGESKLVHVVLICRMIVVPSVRTEFFKDTRLGYIKIAEFRNETASEVAGGLEDIVAQGAVGLILDLRGNDGGDFDQAVALCDIFLPPEKLVAYFLKRDVGRKDQLTRLPAANLGEIKKLVILVDQNTGSSAEITAGALRFHQQGLVMGQRTKGLGSLKNMISLSDGSVLFLITSRTFLPDGTTFDAVGIEPDVLIVAPDDPLVEALKSFEELQITK